jgi:hypothetical protein
MCLALYKLIGDTYPNYLNLLSMYILRLYTILYINMRVIKNGV